MSLFSRTCVCIAVNALAMTVLFWPKVPLVAAVVLGWQAGRVAWFWHKGAAR